jgi:hypothetical protein
MLHATASTIADAPREARKATRKSLDAVRDAPLSASHNTIFMQQSP